MSAKLEVYLEELKQHLRSLPLQQRETELREIENHLSSMIEARKSDGALDSKAVDDSLLQFGTAWHLGRDLMYAYQQRQSEHPVRGLVAGIVALVCQYELILLHSWGVPVFHLKFGINAPRSSVDLWWWCLSVLSYSVFVTPVIASLIASWIAPRRGWWMALAFYATVAVVYSGIVESPHPLRVFLMLAPGLLLGAWLGKVKQKMKKSRFALT